MDLKIAIVGMSDSAEFAPFGQDGWEVWGMPWHNGYWALFDRLFEMHDMTEHHQHFTPKYVEKLKDAFVPLYMQEAYFDSATKYPIEAVGKQYFTSSVAYMMALAISENPDEISIFGVDMNEDSEYRHQRANFEYLIGMAEGKGINVSIHESSPLLKYKNHEDLPYTTRYGWTQ